MSLSIGIVGLPNVGKSTLFNALLKREQALAANYPFATIEPNVGVVDVPDERLEVLNQIVKNDYGAPTKKIIPATIHFYDIAGLVEGAHKGEGLGNKFLANIRETDAILHVVRDFSDANIVKEGSVDPKNDIEIINSELILADLQTMEKRIERHAQLVKKERTTQNIEKDALYKEIFELLNDGKLANEILVKKNLAQNGVSSTSKNNDVIKNIKELNLLTSKPILYVFNIDESELSKVDARIGIYALGNSICLSAKIESELSSLSVEDQTLYMKDLNISKSGLDQVIQKCYQMLNLQTFLTAGPKEVRAWTIAKGTQAPQAAGTIHTDFERGFIKADVIPFDVLSEVQSYKKAKEKGLVRLEGKDYTMQDGDVVEFKFNV